MKRCNFWLSLVLMICVFCFGVVAADPVYVDGTGATAGAFSTLEAAIDALPDEGGSIVVCGDTTIGVTGETVTLPTKNGKVIVTGENNAKLIIAHGIRLGCEMEFDAIELVNISTSEGFISAMGNKLTIGENVTTSVENTERWLTIRGSTDGSEAANYDTHVIVKAGTWRYIYGGGKCELNGNTTVEVSGITVGTLSAENEKEAFNGTSTLIIDLRGNTKVAANKVLQTPTVFTDEGYEALIAGSLYSQIEIPETSEVPETTVVPETTSAPEITAPSVVEPGSVGLIIGIVAAIIVVMAIVVILLKKKK